MNFVLSLAIQALVVFVFSAMGNMAGAAIRKRRETINLTMDFGPLEPMGDANRETVEICGATWYRM